MSAEGEGGRGPARFAFAFATAYRVAALPFGVRPANCHVLVDATELDARFGVWRVRTLLANVTEVEVTGPFAFPKTAGPARLSVADRGLTFATNGDRGVRLAFDRPVSGIEPTGRLRHPELTVTVADVTRLVAVIAERSGARLVSA